MAATGERRADAERNITAILDAAVDLISERPDASMADVARAAGVVRATLYGHFPSRADLLDAVVSRALAEARQAIDAVHPADGPAPDAMDRLVRAAWPVASRHRRISEAVVDTMGNAQLQRRHAPIVEQVRALVERGQAAGTFRTDLGAEWLAASVIGLMHAARDEINEGRMTADEAGDALVATTRPLLSSKP